MEFEVWDSEIGAWDSGIRTWGLEILVKNNDMLKKFKYIIGQSYGSVAPKKVGTLSLDLGGWL